MNEIALTATNFFKQRFFLFPTFFITCFSFYLSIQIATAQNSLPQGTWVNLLNGKNLDGWTIKITGHPLNENYKNTFIVKDGILKLNYGEYKTFNGEIAYLFYNKKLSHYILRIQYRFVGEVTAGVPEWNVRNTGVVIHSQSPQSMGNNQAYPVSLKAQFLGGNGKDERPTGNVVNMGTTLVYKGKPDSSHIINSHSKTYHGNQWVTINVEVFGNDSVRHVIDKQVVLEYEKPQLNELNAEAKKLMINGNKILKDGYIALQGEGQPVDFKKVEIFILKE